MQNRTKLRAEQRFPGRKPPSGKCTTFTTAIEVGGGAINAYLIVPIGIEGSKAPVCSRSVFHPLLNQ